MADAFLLDFDDIFNRYIEANQKKWSHDRSLTVGASEIFDCERKSWFTKLGKKHGFAPDEEYVEDWGAMERGNIIENNYVVPAVKHHMPEGVKVLYTGDDQETFVAGHNSATPDGLITGLPLGCSVRVKAGTQDIVIDNIKSDCICLEIKSIDPRATLVEERAKHHGQTQVQIGLFHEKTEWRPYYSIVLYIDASFLSKLTPFVVEYDPKIYAEAKERAARIYGETDPIALSPEGRFSGSCQHCKWKVACGTAQVGAIPQYDKDPHATPETIAAADELVAIYLQKKAEAEAAEKAQKLASQAIKDFLMSRNVRKLTSPDWSATWYPSDGKKTYDINAMSADGIDVEPYEKQGAPFDVLRITPKKIKTKE
jgi:hypothetical protein